MVGFTTDRFEEVNLEMFVILWLRGCSLLDIFMFFHFIILLLYLVSSIVVTSLGKRVLHY